MPDTNVNRWPIPLAAILVAVLVVSALMLFDARKEVQSAKERLAELEAKLAERPRSAEPKATKELAPEEVSSVLGGLKPLLEAKDEEVRAKALELTALLGEQCSDALLAAALESDPSAKVKLIALDAIGKKRIESCRPRVLGLLESEDGALRRKAAWCLGALGKAQDEALFLRVRDCLCEALRKENDQWAQTLAPKDTPDKKNSTSHIPNNFTGHAIGLLGPFIQALGEVGDAQAAKKLEFYLQHKDPMVRREAVISLGRIGAPESKEPLLKQHRIEADQSVKKALVEVLTGESYKLKYDTRSKKFEVGPLNKGG